MKTNQLPSDLINQAITNLPAGSDELALELWECMKKARFLELQEITGNRKKYKN